MQNQYDWLLKKTPRSVKNLHLWENNPRLDPENNYVHLKDFAEEMTSTDADRQDFIDLGKSIVKQGFIPADPIVIWQDAVSKKFFVAEGNRRVCVLKLLHEPLKAPKGIKNAFAKFSKEIDLSNIEKIHVSIAPTFEDAEWYISQRNSITSLQKRWQREQQQRWVAELYEKYNGDIETIRSQAGVENETELEGILRTLKIKALVKEVENQLTAKEFASASSHRFPISSLERFFNTKKVKEQWGYEFDGIDIKINSKRDSFLNAYAALIKRMLLPRGHEERVDSRSITDKIDTILGSLPTVEKPFRNNANNVEPQENEDAYNEIAPNISSASDDVEQPETPKPPKKDLKNDPNRSRLILECYELHTDNFRMADLFNELKMIPLKYKNSVSASVRIFLDLAVLTYIETENLEAEMKKKYGATLRQITLSKRLEYLKDKATQKSSTIIQKLLNPENELSLDVLNGYVHNRDSHYLDLPFLNKFWDFLFPLFQELLDIKEISG